MLGLDQPVQAWPKVKVERADLVPFCGPIIQSDYVAAHRCRAPMLDVTRLVKAGVGNLPQRQHRDSRAIVLEGYNFS